MKAYYCLNCLALFVIVSLAVSCQREDVEICDEDISALITKSGMMIKGTTIKDDSISFVSKDDKSFWSQFNSLEERIDAFQIPENQLDELSTATLAQAIVDYPLNFLVWAYNEPLDVVNMFFEKSSIHKELLSRDDASIEIKNTYCRDAHQEDVNPTKTYFEDYLMASAIVPRIYSDDAVPEIKVAVEEKLQELSKQQDTCSYVLLRPLLLIDKLCSDPSSLSEFDAYSIVQHLDAEIMASSSSTTTIFTPCGKSLTGFLRSEFPANLIPRINEDFQGPYRNATIISNASNKYNCHSYAWHQSNSSNSVWIDAYYGGSLQLSKYWTNDVYLSCNSSDAEKIYYSNGDHSAIRSSNSGKYISKWGNGPVMEHDPTDCPYSTTGMQYYRTRRTSDPAIQWSLIPMTISGEVFVPQNVDNLYTVTVNQLPQMTKVWHYSSPNPITVQPYFFPSGNDCMVNFHQSDEYTITVDAYYNGVKYGTGVKSIYVY